VLRARFDYGVGRGPAMHDSSQRANDTCMLPTVTTPMPSAFSQGKRTSWLILLLITAAAAVRVCSAATLPCISRDGVFFAQFAEQLERDPIPAMRAQTKQPGYSALLLAVHRLGGASLSDDPALAWERCGLLLSIMGGIAGVWLVYRVTKALFNEKTGLLAALMAVFWPQHVELSGDVLSDAPHLAVYLGSLLAGLAAFRDRRWAWLVLCGMLGGLAYLLRQEGMGAPIAVGVCLLWAGPGTRRARLRQALILATAFLIVVAPYSLAVGRVMPNKTIWDLFTGWHESVAWAAAEKPSYLAGPVYWWNGPLRMLAAWAKSGRYVIATLALVGFWWREAPASDGVARRLVAVAAILQLVAAQLRGLSFGEMSDRYLLIPTALTFPWAASGLGALVAEINERRRQRRPEMPRRPLPALALLIVLAPMATYSLRPAPAGSDWPRKAGAWLATHRQNGDVLLAHPQLAALSFYSGVPLAWPFPGTDPKPSAQRWLQSVAWFADPPYLRRLSGAEQAFLDALRELCEGIEPASRWQVADGNEVRLYEVRRSN